MDQLRPDTRPLYMLVIDRFHELSENGEWQPGMRLPSESELAKQFGVSRATLREALRVLGEEGLIVRRHGIGTFLTERKMVEAGIEQLYSVTEWIQRAGRKPGTTGLNVSKRPPTDDESKSLGIALTAPLHFMRRIRTADGEPVVYCEDRIPESVLPQGLEPFEGSLFKLLTQAGHTIAYAQTVIKPLAQQEHVFQALGVRPGQALLLLEQLHFDSNDCPVLLSSNYFRTDTFQFHVLRRRP